MVSPNYSQAPEPVRPFSVLNEEDHLFDRRIDIKTSDGAYINGVRAYSSFTAFFLKLFGKVVMLPAYDETHKQSNVYYVNKNSLLNKVGLESKDVSKLDNQVILSTVRNKANEIRRINELSPDERFVFHLESSLFKEILDETFNGYNNGGTYYWDLNDLWDQINCNRPINSKGKEAAVAFLRNQVRRKQEAFLLQLTPSFLNEVIKDLPKGDKKISRVKEVLEAIYKDKVDKKTINLESETQLFAIQYLRTEVNQKNREFIEKIDPDLIQKVISRLELTNAQVDKNLIASLKELKKANGKIVLNNQHHEAIQFLREQVKYNRKNI